VAERITVCSLKVLAGFGDVYHYPEFKSIKERIDRVRRNSERDCETVSISDLDEDGRYGPPEKN
jgi:hypothetical protein